MCFMITKTAAKKYKEIQSKIIIDKLKWNTKS